MGVSLALTAVYGASTVCDVDVSMPARLDSIEISGGILTLGWSPVGPVPSRSGPPSVSFSTHAPTVSFWGHPALFSKTASRSVRWIYILRLPLWIPWLVIAPPAAWAYLRARRRFGPGHCTTCGYDLAGNTVGVCPECGTVCGSVKA